MLKLIKIKDPSLRWELLSDFQPETDCLIISDIKTKFSMESELLKKHNFLPGSCVMRAGEFYKEIFSQMDVKWNLTSDHFVQELFSEFCSKNSISWIKNSDNTKTYFEFFNSLLPIFLHPEGVDQFNEWLEQQKKSAFWRSLFNLSRDFFNFLVARKILPESGVKAVLIQELPLWNQLAFPKKRLFVDLSFSFDPCEKEIFQEISRYKEVFILSPELKLSKSLDSFLAPSKDLNIYQTLEQELGSKQSVSFSDFLNKEEKNIKQNSLSCKFFKVTNKTQMEEVKKAVVQVQHWIAKGIPLQDIAIFAPRIEDYWFALRAYFERESIPVKKPVFSKLMNFPDVNYFLSALHFHLGQFDFENLEHFVFYKESKNKFSKFKANYFHVWDRELVSQFLLKNKKLHFRKKVKGKEFVEWALSFWSKSAPSFLFEKVSSVFKELPMEAELELFHWLRLLESELSNSEIEIKEEDQGGLSCLSFNAFPSVKSSHVFILGLNEQSLKDYSLTILNETEKESLLSNLGFSLPLQYHKEKENNFLWFLQSSCHKEVYLSFSSHDFEGQIQTKSLIYYFSNYFFKAQEDEIQGSTLWDKNKKQKTVSQILSQSPMEEPTISEIEKAFKETKQIVRAKHIKLSPNRLKLYTSCPFQYSAEKLFCARDENLIDQELSSLNLGSLAHKMFEDFLNQYPDLLASSQQINDLVQKVMDQEFLSKSQLIYEEQKELIADDLRELLNLFIQKETEERKNFPNLKLKACELKCDAYWDQDKGELSSKGKYKFEGYVDRIDQDESSGDYIIRDYKSSNYKLTNILTWLKDKNKELQLTFYAQFFQKGLLKKFPAGSVSALFYSIYNKDFEKKGFTDKSSGTAELMSKGSRAQQEQDVLNQAIEKSNVLAQTVIQKMEKGEFSPQPEDRKICENCSYQNWCRVETLKE